MACFLALAILCLSGFSTPGADFSPLVVTNLAPFSAPNNSNFPPRQLVPVDLHGTVLIGGSAGVVAVLDGSTNFQWLPANLAQPLQRGQQIRVQGRCLIEGDHLLPASQSFIENDGLHMMYERSATIWLEAGPQPLRVRYFNRVGERGLTLSLAGPGLPRQEISSAWLSHPETNPATGLVTPQPGLQFQCYTGVWRVLPDFSALTPVSSGITSNFDISVAHQEDNFGLVFSGFLQIPHPGDYTLFCNSDDGSQVDLGHAQFQIQPLALQKISPLPHFAAGQLVSHQPELFCAALEGVVTFAARDDTGPHLELTSRWGKTDVRLPGVSDLDPQWLIGARLTALGVCQSVLTAEGYQAAGRLTVYSAEHLQPIDLAKRVWDTQPLSTVNNLSATNSSRLVRLRGVLGETNGTYVLRDETGQLPLASHPNFRFQSGDHLEALGLATLLHGTPSLQTYALRQITSSPGETNALPILTTIEAVKQMSRDEAKRGYPVKVRGVITFVWPNAGFFLQDETWSIDVRLATNAPIATNPQVGEYWEVEGETFAEFAPDILALHASRLGVGVMPEPEHPNWTQLVDGSLDTQYIEVQGVALSIDGNALTLLTRGGRVTVQMPEMPTELLAQFQGALIRVRGCLIPGRDVKTQQVKLGEFELRSASVAVDEPAPADPFALPLEHATDLLLFDAHASPIQRAKISGIVLQQRDDVAYLLDRSNGVRVITAAAADLHPGDQIEAVGFPDLIGPSPVFNSAVVRRIGHVALPPPVPLTADHLLNGQYDSTRVSIEGTLISQRTRGSDQLLEMRTGTRPWLARFSTRSAVLPEFPWGSVLKLTGVYSGLGGDRVRGRDIDSFELLLNSPQDVLVIRSPSWWTARHAFAVALALLAVLLLASIWITALRRQVEERTHALKIEIEDHKRTELELEKKTHLLTQEIEERLRIEAEVERGHKQLLVTSRLAGMAEVATSVLHNVGNVMTSVNVLSASIVELVRNSKISSVTRLGDLLGKNRHELDRFVKEDERGRKIPEYVSQLGSHLTDEQSLLLQKVKVLNENIQHINEIVATQQDYAKVSGVLETLPPHEVIEDALRMHGESLKRHGIKLVREFEPVAAVTVDRHKVLQILFNLLENAKYACLQGAAADKKIIVRLAHPAGPLFRLTVADNGMGIPAENLTRIFGQGFSTRRDGHGFGLHSSVLAAQDMGGSLTALSDGPGKGATFILEIPLTPPGNHPAAQTAN